MLGRTVGRKVADDSNPRGSVYLDITRLMMIRQTTLKEQERFGWVWSWLPPSFSILVNWYLWVPCPWISAL